MSNTRSRKPNRRRRGTGSIIVRDGVYYGKWRAAGGHQIMRRLGMVRPRGTRQGLTRTQAEAELRRLIGADVRPTTAGGDRRTISDVVEAHLEIKQNAGLKRSTVRGYRSLIDAHLVPYFGALPVDRITTNDVAALDRALREAGLKPQSRRNVLGLLGAMLTTAKRRGWLAENPVADYDKPRKARSEPDELCFLTLEELEKVLREMPDDPLGYVERTLVLTAAMTGLRRGELLGLRWKDVDWEARKIRVARTFVGGKEDTPKSASSRRDVPLADRVAGELQRLWEVTPYQAEDAPVFTHPRGTGLPLDGSAVSKRFQLALHRAHVRRVRFHDLRHTFGTMMARDPRVSMRTLQGWLGHSDPATTAIYAHFAPNDLHAAWIQEVFTPLSVGRAIADASESPL